MLNLNTLNPEQKKAVMTTEGPLLVLAGAGSGKTRALTYRIAHLILDENVSPYEILALTFTNKAAREMAERVDQLVDKAADKAWISTFHSCCAKILRIDIQNLEGYSRDFVIYDDSDQLTLITEIQKQLDIREDILAKRAMRAAFSTAKNRSLDPAAFLAQDGDKKAELLCEGYKLYEKHLRANNALDFDDLLLVTLELFKKCPQVLQKYQHRFRYVLVDEYQDTNMSQYEFVRLICSYHKNVCVVGDDDQSIYGWRGADIRNILEFEKDFENTTVIRLEQNYRSTQKILDAANAVIANNSERKEKTLWTENPAGENITLYTAINGLEEADFVCRTILAAVKEGRKFSDFAVLYRTNSQSRTFEEKLTSFGIPFVVYGSLRFYDRKEIKDIIAYLRLMVNPKDDVSLRRIINTPKRGLGDAALTELSNIAASNGLSMLEACQRADELDFTPRNKAKFKSFGDLILQFGGMAEILPLADCVKQLLDTIQFWTYLAEESKKDRREEARVENVKEFINAVADFENGVEENPLSAFLENIALVANANDETPGEQVTLMTLHSAKGLEFSVVFIAGVEEGLFPTYRAVNSEGGLEEERRLCYVGITRAREKLYLTNAHSRMQFDHIARNAPSRFLREIPPEYIDVEGSSATEEIQEHQRPERGPRKNAFNAAKNLATHPLFAPQPQAYEAHKRNDLSFSEGQRVAHKNFGGGTVLTSDGGMLMIKFDSGETKKIAAAYAPLSYEE